MLVEGVVRVEGMMGWAYAISLQRARASGIGEAVCFIPAAGEGVAVEGGEGCSCGCGGGWVDNAGVLGCCDGQEHGAGDGEAHCDGLLDYEKDIGEDGSRYLVSLRWSESLETRTIARLRQ